MDGLESTNVAAGCSCDSPGPPSSLTVFLPVLSGQASCTLMGSNLGLTSSTAVGALLPSEEIACFIYIEILNASKMAWDILKEDQRSDSPERKPALEGLG